MQWLADAISHSIEIIFKVRYTKAGNQWMKLIINITSSPASTGATVSSSHCKGVGIWKDIQLYKPCQNWPHLRLVPDQLFLNRLTHSNMESGC